jgi:hypothetical protein
MKEFMLIFIGGSDAANLSPEEMQNHLGKWFAWIEELRGKGIYIGGEALQPGGKTVKGPKAVVTDGPFAESKEVVGGYFIVKAGSIEEATEIAKACPDLPMNGVVEVREVQKME